MNKDAEEHTPQELRKLKRKPTLHLKTYMQAAYVLGRLYLGITISGAEKKQ